MALSLQHVPDGNETWRKGRLWSRAMDLPEEDRSFHVRACHRAMNLKRSNFFNWPRDQELPPDTHFCRLAEVLQRIEYCRFCRLIADSVSHTSYANDSEVIGSWIIGRVLEGLEAIFLRLRIVPEMMALEDAFLLFDVVLLDDAGPQAEFFSGRRLQADQINLSLVMS